MPLIRLTVPDPPAPAQVDSLAHVGACRAGELLQRAADDRFIVVAACPPAHADAGSALPRRAARPRCLHRRNHAAGPGATTPESRLLPPAVGRQRSSADDILLALTENTAMDWSLGLGVAYGAAEA